MKSEHKEGNKYFLQIRVETPGEEDDLPLENTIQLEFNKDYLHEDYVIGICTMLVGACTNIKALTQGALIDGLNVSNPLDLDMLDDLHKQTMETTKDIERALEKANEYGDNERDNGDDCDSEVQQDSEGTF